MFFELVENFEGWQKILGGGLLLTIIFVGILVVSGEKEAVELPSTINEIKQNVTQQTLEETGNAGALIIQDFNKAGKAMAKDANDPVTAAAIESSMTLAGVGIVLAIIMPIISALAGLFKGL